MMPLDKAWLAIALLGFVSYLTRIIGVPLAGWIPRTAFWQRFFASLPSCLLVSIAIPSFVSGRPAEMAGALVTLLLAMRKMNLIVAMSGGILTVALWRWIMS